MSSIRQTIAYAALAATLAGTAGLANAAPRTTDPFTDGARVGARDVYTDGARVAISRRGAGGLKPPAREGGVPIRRRCRTRRAGR